jgi:hypothetical protein
METAGVEPAPPRCKRGALPSEPRPQVVLMRTGGVEPPQRVAAGLQAAELTHAQRPQEGDRPDSNRYGGDHDPECCRYITVTTKAGTTGFEPATSRQTTERSGRTELRPQRCI